MQKIAKKVLDGRTIFYFVEDRPKGQVGFMTEEDLEKAKRNRQRQNATYPHLRDGKLTEESKKMLRRKRIK